MINNFKIKYEITSFNKKICLDFFVEKTKDFENKKKKHNILVLDISGSMFGVINLLKSFTGEIIDIISKTDELLSIITFGSVANIILEGFKKGDDVNVQDIIDKVVINGSTNGRAALDKINDLVKNDDNLYNVIFLTDGQFNGGCNDDLLTKINTTNNLIFNCVGFTQYHSEQTLQLLCSIGQINGNYTSVYEDIDIVPVADKYVSSSNDFLYNVKVNYFGESEQVFNRLEFGNWKTCIFEEINININDENTWKGKLFGKSENAFRISFLDSEHVLPITEIKEDEFHISTHYLREKVIDVFSNNNYEEIQIINNEIIQLIASQKETSSKRDVKILNQLHHDCSTILKQIFDKKINSSNAQLLLRYIYEHKNQYSISTITCQRICYNSNDFTKMLNLKLLKKMDGLEEKEIELDLETIPYDEKYENEQKYADEHIKCYITLDNWRSLENNCLGIGLYIAPRTTREIKRDLLPDIRMDCHYMSTMAYNTGVYIKFDKNPIKLFSDRDNPVNNPEIVKELEKENIILDKSTKSEVMKMSVNNGFINAWIPIYINKYHWSNAKYYAKSAISLIAFQNNNISNSECILKVYTNLFIRNVVHFVDSGTLPDESIQMFCYLYRTLLELVKEYNLKDKIDLELKNFIEKQHLRSRRYCSNLGDLIQLLFISNKYSYDDIKEYYVPELIRRNAIRLEDIDKVLQSDENIIKEYSKQSKDLFKKSMLVVLLINELKVDKNLEETMEFYDKRWGIILLDKERIKRIKDGFNKILTSESIQDKLKVLNFDLDDNETIGLILWSLRQKDSFCELVFSKPIDPKYEHRKKSCYKTWQLIKDWKKDWTSVLKSEKAENIKKDINEEKDLDYTTIFFYRLAENKTEIDRKDSKLIKKNIRKFVENVVDSGHKIIITPVYKNDKLEFGFIKMSRDKLEEFFNKLNSENGQGQVMKWEYKGKEMAYGLDIVTGQKSVKDSKNYFYKNYFRGNKRMKTKGEVVNKEFVVAFPLIKTNKFEKGKVNKIEDAPFNEYDDKTNVDEYLNNLLTKLEIDGGVKGYKVFNKHKVTKEKVIQDYLINNILIVPRKRVHVRYSYKNKMPVNIFLKENDLLIYNKYDLENHICNPLEDSIVCYF